MEPPVEPRDVVAALADRGLNATPETARRIASADHPDELVAAVAEATDGAVVTEEDLDAVTGRSRRASDGGGAVAAATARPEPSPADASEGGEEDAADGDASTTGPLADDAVVLSSDVTDRSTCTGEFGDFVSLFRDRFRRLRDMLKSRISPRNLSALTEGGRSATAVGMVNGVRQTANGNYLVELEDPTGTLRALLRADDHREEAERLLADEVVGVEGRMSDDGAVLYADSLHRPGVPHRPEATTADVDVRVALTSDLHVGSKNFAADAWDRFTDWLADADVDHLLIAGDLVEGVGVYPDQQEELDVVDIHEQYRTCAERLAAIPDDVDVIALTGNHDSVRLAEPQPALPDEFRAGFPDNVAFAGNPVRVTIHGVDFLLYHGASLNEVVEQIPEARVEEPEVAMRHLLEKRHLAPTYGGHVRLAPEERDYLVIDEVPDVLHMGHVHTFGYERHHGTHVVNTGAWQTQTEYQRNLNIDPDVGYCTVVDLATMEVDAKQFSPD